MSSTSYQSLGSTKADSKFAATQETEVYPPEIDQGNGVEIERIWLRMLPLATTFFASLASATLLYVWRIDLHFGADSEMYYHVRNNRNIVQVIVNVVSSILALLLTTSMSLVVNLTLRIAMTIKPASLDSLQLYTAVSKGFFDLSLSKSSLARLVFLLTWNALPAVLWVGGLTPRVTSRTAIIHEPMAKSGIGSYDFLQPTLRNPVNNGCWQNNQVNGTFTDCPGLYLSARLLESARNPSVDYNNELRVHAKPDNSGYRFQGRSYGVGSSIGLTMGNVAFSPTGRTNLSLSYLYNETGYWTSITCGYNESSDWTLSNNLNDQIPGFPSFFYAKGRLPNSDWSSGKGLEYFAQHDLDPGHGNTLSLEAIMDEDGFSGKAAIAAGTTYALLDKIQCDIVFKPQVFSVNASTTDLLITVSPIETDDIVGDPEPRLQLRQWATKALGTISMVQTTLYVSILGEALFQNIHSFGGDLSIPLSHDFNNTIISATEAAFESMMDDILGTLQATALTIPSAYEIPDQPAIVTVSVVKIGTRSFIFAIAGLHLIFFLGVLGLSTSSRLFARAPRSDFANIGTMVLGAYNGATTRLTGQKFSASDVIADEDRAYATVQILDVSGYDSQHVTTVSVKQVRAI